MAPLGIVSQDATDALSAADEDVGHIEDGIGIGGASAVGDASLLAALGSGTVPWVPQEPSGAQVQYADRVGAHANVFVSAHPAPLSNSEIPRACRTPCLRRAPMPWISRTSVASPPAFHLVRACTGVLGSRTTARALSQLNAGRGWQIHRCQ